MAFDSQQFLVYGVLPSLTAAGIGGAVVWMFSKRFILKQLKLDVQGLVDRAEQRLKSLDGVEERAENTVLIAVQLKKDFEILTKSSVQFPDPNRFRCFEGVYFYIASDGLHPKNLPLCPRCLVEKKVPSVPQQTYQDRGNYSCTCGFKISFGSFQSAIDQNSAL